MNTLITIGWLGVKRAYLNVSREEAIKRFCESHPEVTPDDIARYDMIEEFQFTDEFYTYSASSLT